jgi:ATP-dependent RNA helicase RhlE
LPRREKVDPWFLKPYEPAKSSVQAGDQPVINSTAKPARHKVAVLLGGGPKS